MEFPTRFSIEVSQKTYEKSLRDWNRIRGAGASICRNCVLAIALIEEGYAASVGVATEKGKGVYVPAITKGDDVCFYKADDVGDAIAHSWEEESHGYRRRFNNFPAMVTFERLGSL